ncbi:MAG: hypothetical protein ACTHK0_14895 [Ginsengibacter sp.]
MENKFSSFPIFVIFILTLASCKKDTQNPNPDNANAGYYMRFKLNGIQTQFNSVPIAQSAYNSSDKVYVTGLLAYKDSSKINQDLIDIAVINKDALTAGSIYKDPVKTLSGTDAVPQVILTYYNSQKESYVSMGLFCDDAGNFSFFLPDYKNLVADAKVTVVNIGSNYIKGTFSGTVFKLNSSTSTYDKIPVTEGEFNLRYLH